jgi:signal transduction histidine kinase
MSGNPLKILLIEDNLAEASFLRESLKISRCQKFELVHVQRLEDGLILLREQKFALILLDLTLPDSQGLESLKPIFEIVSDIPIVVLTNTNDEELAIEAVRRGAQDYLLKKEVKGERLIRCLRYAIERKQASKTFGGSDRVLADDRVQQLTAELNRVKELDRLKSEFVSMLSHDFRNPLSTILASTGLLQNNERQLTKEKKTLLFQLIRSASKNMAQLLDEIIMLGQADAAQLQCLPERLNLNTFCLSLLEELQISIAEKQLTINFLPSGNLTDSVWDIKLLKHILNNLLGNAIKYSHQNNAIDFELIAQETEVIFKIRDRGIGIPPEEQPRLFEPFHRANNVGQIPGTGLGLAIVKRCTEAHGGQITFESQVGIGTTFTVALPVIATPIITKSAGNSQSTS